MTTNPALDTADDVYEVTLAGALGPVLSEAFKPWHASSAHVCTVVYTELSPEVDLVDLVAAMDAHGLEVEAITAG
jgi:hypothetical protein